MASGRRLGSVPRVRAAAAIAWAILVAPAAFADSIPVTGEPPGPFDIAPSDTGQARVTPPGVAPPGIDAPGDHPTPAPASTARPPAGTGFVDKVFRDEAGEHKYIVYVPADYTPAKRWPIILFLHGAGERGNDGRSQAEVGLGALIRRWGKFPWVVAFPQAEDTRGPIREAWAPDSADGRRAMAILDQVEKDYNTDPKHRVLTGWSMGGRGTYLLGAAYPEKWAAIMPVSGWAEPVVELRNGEMLPVAERLARKPVWALHGTDDSIVPLENDVTIVEALKAAGGKPYFTTIPEGEHYVWRTVYASPNVFRWLSDPSQFAERPVLDPLPGVEMTRDEVDGPFVPAVLMRNAIAVALGPHALEDASETISKQLTKEPKTGWMPGSVRRESVAGISFKIVIAGMRYKVPITGAEVIPTDRGTLLIRLGISRAELTLTRTDVSALLCRATAGPTTALIAHRRPIAVEAEVRPVVEGNGYRLKAESVKFDITPDNWVVYRPRVKSNSIFLPEGRVAQSLVDGVFESEPQIEREFRRSVADTLEKQPLDLPAMSESQMMASIWPVPVYRPRTRFAPASVSINAKGIALVFDVIAAAVDAENGPKTPAPYDLGLGEADVVRTGDITVVTSENLIGPLASQIVDAGVAHINVRDIPDRNYLDFVDRQVMGEIIPAIKGLPPEARLRAELELRKPLRLTSIDADAAVTPEDDSRAVYRVEIPELALVVSVQEGPDAAWREWAEFPLDIHQPLAVKLGRATTGGREIITECTEVPTVTGTAKWLLPTPPADDALETAKLVELFAGRWRTWKNTCGPNITLVPDLTVQGYTRRLERLEPVKNGLAAIFEEPLTVLRNDTDAPLVYRTARLDGAWGEPITLPPGGRNDFRVSVPIRIQVESPADGRSEFELPAGRSAVFESEKGDPPTFRLFDVPSPSDSGPLKPEAMGGLPHGRRGSRVVEWNAGGRLLR